MCLVERRRPCSIPSICCHGKVRSLRVATYSRRVVRRRGSALPSPSRARAGATTATQACTIFSPRKSVCPHPRRWCYIVCAASLPPLTTCSRALSHCAGVLSPVWLSAMRPGSQKVRLLLDVPIADVIAGITHSTSTKLSRLAIGARSEERELFPREPAAPTYMNALARLSSRVHAPACD